MYNIDENNRKAKTEDGIIDCNSAKAKYYKKVFEYKIKKRYNQRITDIYHNYQIKIDDNVYPIDKFYITIDIDNLKLIMHLINIKSKYTDILTNSNEKYEFSDAIKLMDTTAFIELINSNYVVEDNNEKVVTIVDKNGALEIIRNWDGMIHDKVAETDAVDDKNYLNVKYG